MNYKFIHNFECKDLDGYLKLNYLIQFAKAKHGAKKAKQLLYDYYGRVDVVAQGSVKHIALVELSKDLVKAELTLSDSG